MAFPVLCHLFIYLFIYCMYVHMGMPHRDRVLPGGQRTTFKNLFSPRIWVLELGLMSPCLQANPCPCRAILVALHFSFDVWQKGSPVELVMSVFISTEAKFLFALATTNGLQGQVST